jgi:hypothetical protein
LVWNKHHRVCPSTRAKVIWNGGRPILDNLWTGALKKTIVTKSIPQHSVCSDGEDDNVPLVTLMANKKLHAIADAAANITIPDGEACALEQS